jgi:hypothetical protein
MAKYYQSANPPRGGSAIWSSQNEASVVVNNEFFDSVQGAMVAVSSAVIGIALFATVATASANVATTNVEIRYEQPFANAYGNSEISVDSSTIMYGAFGVNATGSAVTEVTAERIDTVAYSAVVTVSGNAFPQAANIYINAGVATAYEITTIQVGTLLIGIEAQTTRTTNSFNLEKVELESLFDGIVSVNSNFNKEISTTSDFDGLIDITSQYNRLIEVSSTFEREIVIESPI